MGSSDQGSAEGYFELSEESAATGGSVTPVDAMESYEIAAGLFFRPFYAENISLNFVTFPPDSGFPSHVHPEEQVSIVREGEMEITIGGEAFSVKAGDVIHFPSGIPHSGRTTTQPCRLIDIFSPPRTGIKEVVAAADPVRNADVDRWWYDSD